MSKYKDLMKSYIYIYIRSKRFLYFDIYLNTAYTTHYAYLQYMVEHEGLRWLNITNPKKRCDPCN